MRWLLCLLGRHYFVEYLPDGYSGESHIFCLWCGRARP